jgi:hypothetical protein
MVWHDLDAPEFHKQITLRDRTVGICYGGVPPGHTVSNEFCVDLLAAVLQAEFQTKTVGPDRSSIRLSSAAAVAVTVRLGQNCQFSSAALTNNLAEAVAAGQADASEYLRLHRVLTDNLEIVCQDGGNFDYAIEFT